MRWKELTGEMLFMRGAQIHLGTYKDLSVNYMCSEFRQNVKHVGRYCNKKTPLRHKEWYKG